MKIKNNKRSIRLKWKEILIFPFILIGSSILSIIMFIILMTIWIIAPIFLIFFIIYYIIFDMIKNYKWREIVYETKEEK